MYNFSFEKVNSVEEAVAAIQKAEDGKFVAGGQTMLPTMKHRFHVLQQAHPNPAQTTRHSKKRSRRVNQHSYGMR